MLWRKAYDNRNHSKKYVVRILNVITFLTTGLFASQPSGLSMGKALGVTEQDDMYEVAGCMLRLALWPTNKLYLISLITTHIPVLTLSCSLLIQAGVRSLAYTSSGFVVRPSRWCIQPTTITSSHTSNMLHHLFTSTRSSIIQVAVHYRCGDSSFNANHLVQTDSCSRASINNNLHVHSMAACAKNLLMLNKTAASNSSTTNSLSSSAVKGRPTGSWLFLTLPVFLVLSFSSV